MIHKVSAELCVMCEYRTRESAFMVHHCDYASITGKCRLDTQGTCSHYKKDENYDPNREKIKKAIARERQRKYKEEHKKKSIRPRGRPKGKG